MKKTVALLLAVILMVFTVACGSTNETKGNEQQANNKEESTNSGKENMVIAVNADIDKFHPSDLSTQI